MDVTFTYSREKDIWCLLNKGRRSNSSSKPTKAYQQLITTKEEATLTENDVSLFIDEYVKTENILVEEKAAKFQTAFDSISNQFEAIAENVFEITFEKEITAYLTINSRCPYKITESLFFVSTDWEFCNTIAMHELWHFYTWERFGTEEMKKLGKEKYNTIKEALTVLLNVECAHLFPADATDEGYPQHQKLRAEITKWWSKTRDIQTVWTNSIKFITK